MSFTHLDFNSETHILFYLRGSKVAVKKKGSKAEMSECDQ